MRKKITKTIEEFIRGGFAAAAAQQSMAAAYATHAIQNRGDVLVNAIRQNPENNMREASNAVRALAGIERRHQPRL